MPPIPVIYREIEGFPGYRVGTDGTVWTRWKPAGGRNADGSYPGGMCLGQIWRQMTPSRAGGNGAFRVDLRRSDGKLVHKFVHVIVLECFVGPRPAGMVCRHGPNGKYNNSVYNLRWGTQKENIADKERDGTKVVGERHHYAKLTADVVRAARDENARGATTVALAKKYGVSQSSMWAALRHQTWRHVT